MNKSPDSNNKTSFIAQLRNYLLTGLIIIGPLILTILIIMWLVNLVDSLFSMFLHLFPQSYIPKGASLPGVGLLVVLLFVIFVGILGKNFLGKYIISTSEKILNKVPVVKFIYGTIRQIFDTVFSSKGKAFKSTVLVEFPTKDSWTIGFLTSEVKDTLVKKAFDEKYNPNEEIISVFVPATPNPTSGFLLYVLRKNVIPLSFSPNTAMKIILSGGMLSPSDIHENEKNIVKNGII